MHTRPDHLKAKSVAVLASLLLITVTGVSFSFPDNDDFNSAKQEILIRKIGHEVLLQSGDSTSLVLPVKKISDTEYELRFANEFTFQPDSLVSIVKRSLAKGPLAEDYIVNVMDCPGIHVVFGYAILGSRKDEIISCSRRVQPRSCYVINIRFQPAGISVTGKKYILGGLPVLAFVGFIILRSVRSRKNYAENRVTKEGFTLGSILFDPLKKRLTTADTSISLTAKETRLLLIFARSPDTIIERAQLQKEIWEDEGVIVGRSLDMFISKLRKKLETDPSVRLVNIHGKGYKLSIV